MHHSAPQTKESTLASTRSTESDAKETHLTNKMKSFQVSFEPKPHNIKFMQKEQCYVSNPDALPINGLNYIPNFLSEAEEEQILLIIDSNPFDKFIHRHQQFYGEKYYHTTNANPIIQPVSTIEDSSCLSMEPFRWLIDKLYSYELENNLTIFGPSKDSSPTQILMNEYVGNMGISNHFDDPDAFGEVIVTISLMNPLWMNLTLPEQHTNQCQELLTSTKILLERRSLFVMRDDARYEWRHGISKSKWMFLPSGESVYRDREYRRISLTIRKVLDGRRRCTIADPFIKPKIPKKDRKKQ